MLLCNFRCSLLGRIFGKLQSHKIKVSITVTIHNKCNVIHSTHSLKTLDTYETTLEHQMKCKNTRSSGKTLGVAPVAWTWEQTLIAAAVLGHPEGWAFEPARTTICVVQFLLMSYFHWTWAKLEQIYTDQWHLTHTVMSLHRLNIVILKLNQTLWKNLNKIMKSKSG